MLCSLSQKSEAACKLDMSAHDSTRQDRAASSVCIPNAWAMCSDALPHDKSRSLFSGFLDCLSHLLLAFSTAANAK